MCKVEGPVYVHDKNSTQPLTVPDESVIKCKVNRCGRYYHRACVLAESERFVSNDTQTVFTCPCHTCLTCGGTTAAARNSAKDSRALMPCARCPVAFHKNCIPPEHDIDVIIKNKYVLCEKHQPMPTTGKSKKDLREERRALEERMRKQEEEENERMRLEEAENKRYIHLFGGKKKSAFFPDVKWLPSRESTDFRIPEMVLSRGRNWVPTEPPFFKRVISNFYHPSVPKPAAVAVVDRETCMCKEGDECKDGCMNRAMNVECSRKCHASCTNQRISKRQYAKTKTALTIDNRGWGLVAKEDIKAGSLIIEYCGEVVTEEVCDARLQEAKKKGITNFYMFRMENDLVIDASECGNNARFVNHSCSPNCITQKWYIGNALRAGIFAKRDIPANTELTYDYNFLGYWEAGKAQPCLCGSKNCSKFLGQRPKKVVEKPKKLTKKRIRELAKIAAQTEAIKKKRIERKEAEAKREAEQAEKFKKQAEMRKARMRERMQRMELQRQSEAEQTPEPATADTGNGDGGGGC